MKGTIAALGLLLAAIAGAAADGTAQRPPSATSWELSADTLPAYLLEGVTVSVARAPVSARDLPQRVEVITRTDIERTPGDEVADLLKKHAGVDVIQFPGLLAGVGIRGFRPEYSGINQRTLLLIDGRPSGVTNLALLDPNRIERIEVLRGPASALYGSSAMGGVVNIVTRRHGASPGGSFRGAYGSFDTRETGAEAGGQLSPRLDVDLSMHRFARRGDYRIGSGNFLRDHLGDSAAVKLHPGGGEERVPEVGDGVVRENSQYATRSASARLGYLLTDSLRAEVGGSLFEGKDVQVPGNLFFGSSQDLRKHVRHRSAELRLGGAGGATRADGRGEPGLRVFLAEEDNEYLDIRAAEPFVDFADGTVTRGGQLQGVWGTDAHRLAAGVDFVRTTATSRSYAAAEVPVAPWNPDSELESRAVFAQAMLGVGARLTTTFGARADRVTLALRETPLREDVVAARERFTTVNPSAGVQWRLSDGVRVHANGGRAFVAPTAFTRAGLAQPGAGSGVVAITAGNPEVRPERSVTYDAGIALGTPRSGFDAELTFFRTRVRDRITSVIASFPEGERPLTPAGDEVATVQTYVNAVAAQMRGFEWSLGYDLGARSGYRYSLRAYANGTHLGRAEERVTAAAVDASRFAGRADFQAREVLDALVFGEASSVPIRNVADRTVNVGLEYDDLRRFSTRLSGRYVGERIDTDFTDWTNVTDIRYPPFMVLDVATAVRLGERSRISLSIGNLTDENYYEVRGYNLPGRELRLTLSLGM